MTQETTGAEEDDLEEDDVIAVDIRTEQDKYAASAI